MKRHFNGWKLALLIPAVHLSQLLQAQQSTPVTIGWHDQMYLQPGDTVRLNRQFEPAFPGLMTVSQSATNVNRIAIPEKQAFAQKTSDMIRTLNANSSASLNTLVFGGDVGVSFFGRQTFDANDLTFVDTVTKDYGWNDFTPTGFTSNFWNQVAIYQKTLQGSALYAAITSTFGSYYVQNYHSVAMVSVIYNFHFAAATGRQQLLLNASASYGAGSIDTTVESFFNSANTNASLSYQFYSTDPNDLATNLGVATIGTLHSYLDYSNLTARVASYANGMTAAHAKIYEYQLYPLTADLSLVKALGQNFQTPPPNVADYDTFLEDYTALQAYKQNLDPWILSGDSLSWLNAQGRQVVQDAWSQAVGYLSEMKTVAANHFTAAAPLNVPADVLTFLGTLTSQISLPAIHNIQTVNSGSSSYFIGRVDCGCQNWMITLPFNTLTELHNGTNEATLSTIYYDAAEFMRTELAANPSGAVHTALTNLFVSQDWNCYTNNPNLNGFFLVEQPTSTASQWTLMISGGTDVNGNAVPVAELPFLDTTPSSCPGNCTIVVTNTLGFTNAFNGSFGGTSGLAGNISPAPVQLASAQAYIAGDLEPRILAQKRITQPIQ